MSNLTELELSVIRTDGGTQPRAKLNQEVIEEYAEMMKTGVGFPPVVAFYDGVFYWLADGFHRFEAAQKAGKSPITADIRQGTRRDAVLFSVGANAAHGLRRTNADKRRAVQTLLYDPEWSQWSDLAIARLCGVSDRFVNNFSKELTPNRSQSFIRRGADGRIINTTNISKRTRDFMDKNQVESSPKETRAKPVEEGFTPIPVSLSPQRQLPIVITTDVNAEVMEDDEEFSTPTEPPPEPELPPQSEPQDGPSTDTELTEVISPNPTPRQAKLRQGCQNMTLSPMQFEVGDRIRIFRCQHGRDKWTGKTARIWQITPDGWLRVDVEGTEGVRLTLRLDWVERVPQETPKQPDEQLGPPPAQGGADQSDFESPAIAKISSMPQEEAPPRFQAGDRLYVSDPKQQNWHWNGEVAEVLEISNDRTRVVVEICCPSV